MLFAVGIIGTGSPAVPVLAGSTAYALAERLGWREGLAQHFSRARGFYAVIIASIVVGLAMNLSGIPPIRALYYAAVLNGVAAPPVLLLMLILGGRGKAVPRYRSGCISNLLVSLAFVLMTALPVAYVIL